MPQRRVKKKSKPEAPKKRKYVGLIGFGSFALIITGIIFFYQYMNYTTAMDETAEGKEKWENGDASLASRYFHNAMLRSPDCVECLKVISNFYYIENHDHDYAYELIDRAFDNTSEDEQTSFMHELRGKCEFKRGDYEWALTDLNSALEKDPNADSAHYYLALTHIKLENTEKALSHLELFQTNHVLSPSLALAFSKVEDLKGDTLKAKEWREEAESLRQQ